MERSHLWERRRQYLSNKCLIWPTHNQSWRRRSKCWRRMKPIMKLWSLLSEKSKLHFRAKSKNAMINLLICMLRSLQWRHMSNHFSLKSIALPSRFQPCSWNTTRLHQVHSRSLIHSSQLMQIQAIQQVMHFQVISQWQQALDQVSVGQQPSVKVLNWFTAS
jgi:hypothetical protein